MRKLLSLFAVSAITVSAYAQQSFTVDQSLEYALQNNVQVKKAKIDMTIADQKVKETVGIGLPQINGEGKYNNFLNTPVQMFPAMLIPAQYLPPEMQGQDLSNVFIPLKFAQKHSMQGGFTLSQLLFNGSYIVGLESSKAYKETAALVKEKTDISIKEGILLSYTGVLVMDENIATLNENKKVLEKTLSDTKKTYEVGLIEYQNVEQLEYSYKNLTTNIENLKRNRTKLLMALKYLMGYPMEEPMELTTSLAELIDKNQRLVANDSVDLSKHIDIRMRENALKLNELKLKLQKSKALPTLAAALSTNWAGNNNSFSDLLKGHFYNTSVFALQLDVPIFSGLQRHWLTEQAKLDVEKARLDKDDTERNLKNELFARATDYENAFESYQTSKDLVSLSSEIYRKQQIKFKEGLGTSFDLMQSENQLYESQGKLYNAALELINSAIKLDKANGTL